MSAAEAMPPCVSTWFSLLRAAVTRLSLRIKTIWNALHAPLRVIVFAMEEALSDRDLRLSKRPDWPRLMNEGEAALYLSIGATTLRLNGPKAKRHGRRSLYDRQDLDRWADALDPKSPMEKPFESDPAEVEQRFFARRGHVRA